MIPRPAVEADFAPAARLWADGWAEAHIAHVPEALTRLRTVEDFERRLRGFGDGLRVAGPEGAPFGLCVVRGHLLDQIFVSPDARGTGLAKTLLADGEARIAAAGFDEAELDCIPENTHARTFYERMGWVDCGIEDAILESSDGPFTLPCVIFKKSLSG